MNFYSYVDAQTGEIFEPSQFSSAEKFLAGTWQAKVRFVPVHRFADLVVQARKSGALAHPDKKHVTVWERHGQCSSPGTQRIMSRDAKGNDELLVLAVAGGPRAVLDVVIPCNSCRACRGRRRAKWCGKAEREICAGAHSTLCTFTLNGKSLRLLREKVRASLSLEDRDVSVRSSLFQRLENRAINELWAGFRARVSKYTGGMRLVFQSCIERGARRGRVHLHVLLTVEAKEGNKLLPNEFLREEWAEYSGGRHHKREVDRAGIRRLADVKAARAAGTYRPLGFVNFRARVPGGKLTGGVRRSAYYISKYVGKDAIRINSSQYFGRPLERPGLLAQRAERRRAAMAERLRQKAYALAFASEANIRAFCAGLFNTAPSNFIPWNVQEAERQIAYERAHWSSEGLSEGRKSRKRWNEKLILRWASLLEDAQREDRKVLEKLEGPIDPKRLYRARVRLERQIACLDIAEARERSGILAEEVDEPAEDDVFGHQTEDEIWAAWKERAQELHDDGVVQLTDEEIEDLGLHVDPPF